MTAFDQMKLLNAGFMIIRRDENRRVIKAKTIHKPEWNIIERFNTKSHLANRMKGILQNPKIVEL